MKIHNKWNFDDNEIGIDDMSITYIQNPDSNSHSDEYQTLTVSTQNNGSLDGWYYNISTNKWSIDDGSILTEIIEDFKNRFNIIRNENSNNS